MSEEREPVLRGSPEQERMRLVFRQVVLSRFPQVLDDLAAVFEAQEDEWPSLVDQWAERWHLDSPWLIDLGLRTLAWWKRDPDSGTTRRWAHRRGDLVYHVPALANGPTVVYTYRLPDLGLESESTATERIMRDFAKHLREQMERIGGTGRRKPVERRARYQHAEWLVRYQCLGESMEAIARSLPGHVPRETVGKPVRQVADLIGLELRPPARGRPKKMAT